jgi:hypothetical protein
VRQSKKIPNLSAHMPKSAMYADACPFEKEADASVYLPEQAIWVNAIRLSTQNSDIDGQLSVYMPNLVI